MGIIELIILISVVGFILYLVTQYIPMPAPFKQVIIVIAVIALILYALRNFGLGL